MKSDTFSITQHTDLYSQTLSHPLEIVQEISFLVLVVTHIPAPLPRKQLIIFFSVCVFAVCIHEITLSAIKIYTSEG